ncbi:hypothetical protein MSAN_02360500 [Mycena sanguinolenta]|uniref:Uncharacterized protein n=1 Tax=Mycena sanguinolenta TaxID=230812 RepID=A0A8H7CG95_9AGAR|nr:hypothetical protein MSAN_02360500 [Mycena sanguinolenta]
MSESVLSPMDTSNSTPERLKHPQPASLELEIDNAYETSDPIIPEFEILLSWFFNLKKALAKLGMLLVTAEMQEPIKAIIDADDHVIDILNYGPTDWEYITNKVSTAINETVKLLYRLEYNQEPLSNSSRHGPHYAEHIGAGIGDDSDAAVAKFGHRSVFLFQIYTLRLYAYYLKTIQALQTWDPNVSFFAPLLFCVFTCVTFNFSPQTITLLHLDFLNLALGWCFITALALYNHWKGGHLIIWDLRLIIEFLSGAAFAIPSAVLHYSDVAVLHYSDVSIQKGEKRFSIM